MIFILYEKGIISMKKITRLLLLMLLVTTVFVGGCGKTEAEKTYEAFLAVPLGSNVEVAKEKWGKDIEVHSAGIALVRCSWKTPGGNIEARYFRGMLMAKGLDENVIFAVAKDKNLYAKDEKLPSKSLNNLNYEQVRDVIGCEGLVYACEDHYMSQKIGYVWVSKKNRYYAQEFTFKNNK